MHQSKMSREFQPEGGRPSARLRCRRIAAVLMILLLPGLLGAWKIISGDTIDPRHVERIQDGKTTKNEILLLFGDPQEIDRTPEGVTYTYKNFKDAPAMPYRPKDRKIAPQSDQLYLLDDNKQIKKAVVKTRRQDPEEHPAHSLQTRWTDGDEPRVQRILRGAGMTAFADLAQATAWVFDLQKFGIKFGLSSTLSLLDRLKLDYREGRYIHIAGTNGKGSVAAMLSAILSRAGYPVGMFTSPHLVSFSERFRLGDEEVSPERLLALINEVRAAVDDAEPPTFFEFATAMAFLYFLQAGAAPIILETGMGGRLDATNVVQPLVSVITNISRDHQEHLGEGLLAIAGEKAGIIKPGAPLVTYARQKQVLQVFRSRCREVGAPLYQGGIDFKTRGKPRGSFDYFGLQQHISGLTLNLRGRHQYGNAAVALAVVELLGRDGFPVPEAAIREGLATARWPGRLEVVPQDPRVMLDGAHNPAAALTLAQNLKKARNHGRLILVMGVMADKDVDTILARLLPLAQMVIFTQPQYFRAATPRDLARRAQPYGLEILQTPRVAAAVQQAQSLAGPEDQIVVTGSLYTVGEAKEYFRE